MVDKAVHIVVSVFIVSIVFSESSAASSLQMQRFCNDS